MKTFKLLTAGLAIITLLFTSCKKEEETQDETANLTLAKTSLTLKVGEYEKVAIKTGNGTYTATSSDITKATVSLVNNELTITALAEGLATVTVSDAKNRTADISVKVLDLVVPGEHITLLKGKTATRTISFGNDYKVATTDAAIATATIANNLLTIEAINKGNALVTVKDLVSEKVQTFSVTVESQPLALSVATVALTKGEKVAVAIVSGNSSYTVSVADTAVAAATVSGTTVTVTGVGVGTTKITVKDADDKTAELSVTVNALSLALEKTTVEVNADAAVEVAIRSGNGNYTLQVADNSKATATIVGDKVRIEGKEAGTTKVTVKDSQNKTAEITVTVKPRGLSLERTALTINAGTTAEVAIFSGNGGYTVQVADNNKVTASVVNNKVRIEAKAAGTTKVTVKDSQNKTAEITVTVNAFSLTLERNAVEVNADAAVEVAITAGNGNYTLQVADNSKATATIVGDKVRIEGKAAGTTKVTVKDSQNKTAEITVTVKPRGLSLERTALTINAGTTAEVAIFSGNGGYTVQVADNSKVTASVVNNKVRIEGKAAGTTKVTVKDNQNKTAEITVTVNAFSLTLERNAVELNPDDTAEVSITNGNGNYTLQVADNSKATATIVGNKVRIEGKAAGTTKVTVKDSQNKTAEITVTVKPRGLSLERTALTINAGTTAEVAIFSGNGGYTVQVADNSKVTASVVNNKVRIEAKAAGTTKVTVKDGQNKTAEITVTVNAFSLTLERNAVEVNADAAVYVAITAGNGNYTVQVADNSKATATISPTIVGDIVRIEGKAAGTTKVTVKDSQNKTAEITVTVNAFSLTLERTALTINAGTTAEVAITAGNGNYTVQVADNSKVTASVVNNKVHIEAKAAGTTKVIVKDSQNKTAEITVTVNAFSLTLERTTLTINAGTTAEVAITAGNGNYTLQVADNSKVTASVVNNKVHIEAKAAGTTKVIVKDSQNKTAEITVTVKPRGLSLERTALTINAGTTAEIAITAGNGNYTVQVADNSKVTASVVNNKVRIEAKAAGTTKVTVKDGQNKTAEITVTVNAFSLTLERTALTINAGTTAEVAITAGNGNYTLQVADNSKVTASVVNNKVRIEGKAAGTTKVTVKDSQNKTAEITVTINPFNLSLERNALTINAGTTAEVAIFSGNGGYTVQVADNSKVTASVVNNKVRIEGKAAGTTKVTVKDSQNKTAEISVTVSPRNLTVEKMRVELNAGANTLVTITNGNGGYTALSEDNNKVTAQIEGNGVRITAKAAGTAKVTVKDSANKQVEIVVVVKPYNLTVDKTEVEVNVGATAEVAIRTGNGGYSVPMYDNTKVQVAIVGSTVRITGKAAGETSVTVKDSQDKTVEIMVTVKGTDLELAQANVEVNVGATADVAIVKGTAPYTVSVINSSVATAEIIGGNKVRIKGVGAGTTKVTIGDDQSKQASIMVTVKAASTDDLFDIVEGEDNEYEDYQGERVIEVKGSASAIIGNIVLPARGTVLADSALEYSNVSSVDFNNVKIIGEGALHSSPNLTKVLLRKVTKIKSMAFAECNNLKEVRCYMNVPPTVKSDAFEGIAEDAVLWVPRGKKGAYEAKKAFSSSFSEIKEM